MSKQLAENVPNMSNPEIIGLAKNRWLPKNVQMAIARLHYRRGQCYLAENAGLDAEVRDYLWSDACNRGYSLKTLLLMCGHYTNDPDKYRELYDKYPSAWSRSFWRMSSAFFGNYWSRGETSATPSDLLNRIYDEQFSPKIERSQVRYNVYSMRQSLDRLARHPNVDLTLAIKLSQCGDDRVQKLGFEKIVEIKRRQDVNRNSNK